MYQKLLSIGKGALIAAIGAAAFYVIKILTEMSGNGDFGDYGLILIPALAVIANAVRKFLLDWEKPSTKPEIQSSEQPPLPPFGV